jgi:hypothetical protein
VHSLIDPTAPSHPLTKPSDGPHLAFEGGQLCLSCTGKRLNALRASRNFCESAGNAFYSVVEYIAQPLSMLVVAPFWCISWGALTIRYFDLLVSAILGQHGHPQHRVWRRNCQLCNY